MKCVRKRVLNDRLQDGRPIILTYITMAMHVTILCNLRFCYIVCFNCYWYLRVLMLTPHFLQCCLLYHLVNIMFEFMKPYMFLFYRSFPKIQRKMDVKKINHRPTVCIKYLIDEPRLIRQFQINVLHPWRGNLCKPEIQKEIGKKFKITHTQKIFIYGSHIYRKRS